MDSDRFIIMQNRKGLSEFLALVAVVIMAIVLYLLGVFGQLNFQVKKIEFALREEAESKLFTLMSSTHSGYAIENLVGYYLLTADAGKVLKNL